MKIDNIIGYLAKERENNNMGKAFKKIQEKGDLDTFISFFSANVKSPHFLDVSG